jgi:hypothetical protein
MTQALNFHNTTNLSGDALKKKDASAGSQQDKIVDIMIHLQNAVEWWTRDALNREFTRRHGKRLKDQSISRALSNLSAWFCTKCKKYVTKQDCDCLYTSMTVTRQGQKLWNQPKLQKSDTAMWNSDEGDKVHAWRLAPNPGQGSLFGSEVDRKQDGLQ